MQNTVRGRFFEIQISFFSGRSPFVNKSWCKIPLDNISFEIAILLFYIAIVCTHFVLLEVMSVKIRVRYTNIWNPKNKETGLWHMNKNLHDAWQFVTFQDSSSTFWKENWFQKNFRKKILFDDSFIDLSFITLNIKRYSHDALVLVLSAKVGRFYCR